jgi:hypothetical protein
MSVGNSSKREVHSQTTTTAPGNDGAKPPRSPSVVDNLPAEIPVTEQELAVIENFLADLIDAALKRGG